MAGQKKTREKIMEEALKDGAKLPAPITQRSMPPMELHGACDLSDLSIDDLCNALIDGYSLRDVAAELDRNHLKAVGKPRSHGGKFSRMHATTILRWVEQDAARVRAYEQAREMQADAVFSELFQLSNEPIPLTIFGSFDSGAVQDKKVRIDTLKFIASKLAPRRYGEKLDLTSGGDKLPEMSPAQADARLAALLVKARASVVSLPALQEGKDGS